MSFSQYYDEKKLKREISNASISLIVPGIVLATVSLMRYFVSEGFSEAISVFAVVFGLVLVVLGTFFPRYMLPVTKKLYRLFNKLGVVILKALLIPVYIVTYITTFWYAKRKNREYLFVKWDGEPSAGETYFKKEDGAKLNEGKSFRVIGSIFSGISVHKMYILLPLIIVLLLIGLLFFFISSSAVFSFIYTFV